MSTSDNPDTTTAIAPNSPLADRTVVILGGGSGMGYAVARRSVAHGARVVLGGRTADRLAAAAETLGERASWRTVDTTDQESPAAFFAPLERVDHLFTPAASLPDGPHAGTGRQGGRVPLHLEVLGAVLRGQARRAQAGPRRLGGAGLRCGERAPVRCGPAYAACNAAVEGLGRGLAVELAPVRVNVVSPGALDGDLWGRRPAEVREEGFARYREATLLGRIGTEDEVADSVVFLFGNRNMTGSTLCPDGGYALR